MHALSECVCVFLGRDADDQVTPAANDVVALALELVGELVRLVVRAQLDPHLPRRVVVRQLVLLPGLLGGLARPALLLGEPALDLDLGLDPLLHKLGLDDAACLLGLSLRLGIDEDRVVVAGDREAVSLQLLGEALRLVGPEVEPEALEQRLAVRGLARLDPDAPVVGHAAGAPAPASASGRPNILSEIPTWSRYLVIPPSQNGQRAPSRSAVSTSFASATTPSCRRWWISSASASSAVSSTCSRESGACSWTTISSLPSA